MDTFNLGTWTLRVESDGRFPYNRDLTIMFIAGTPAPLPQHVTALLFAAVGRHAPLTDAGHVPSLTLILFLMPLLAELFLLLLCEHLHFLSRPTLVSMALPLHAHAMPCAVPCPYTCPGPLQGQFRSHCLSCILAKLQHTWPQKGPQMLGNPHMGCQSDCSHKLCVLWVFQ